MRGIKDKQRTALILGVLALVTLAIFWRVRECDFINFDDDVYVTHNAHVRAGLSWASVTWAFQSLVASNWHPLTWISHILDCQFYGLRPGGHHLTNLLFHIANTLLLFTWLRRLTGAVWRSALVAALFAWHPLHVESVAWVAERKDVLSTFFWLLTLLAYQKFKSADTRPTSSKFKAWYGLTLLFFILGLLSKPMVVTLPFVLLLVDWWSVECGARSAEFKKAPLLSSLPWRRLIQEKIPFFALSAASCVMTYFAQKHGGAVASFENLPLGGRLANALVSYLRYLGKMIWPDDLAIFYPYSGGWESWQVAGAAIALLAISLLVLKNLRQRPYLAVGWFWFLGTLVPVIGLVQVGGQSIADRYAYVPLIGVFIMLVWGGAELAEWSKRPREAAGLAVLILAGCLLLTWRQVGYWRDTESLFKHTIKATGDNYIAFSNLGTFLTSQNKPDEAAFYFGEALRVNPSCADAYVNLGDGLAGQGHVEQGIEHLLKALELDPDHVEAHFDLGNLLMRQGKTPEAIAQYREAARLRPGWAAVHKHLAKALLGQGDLTGAVDEFTTAAKADPGDVEIQQKLAALLAEQHQLPEAIAHYHEAVRLYHEELRLTPDSPTLLNNLAWLLATNPNAEVRNGPEAVALAQRACEIDQWKHAVMIGTLAAAQAEAGQFDEAVKTAHQAQQLALTAGEPQIAAKNEELIKLYASGKAARDQ